MNEFQKPKQIYLVDLLLYCLEKWRWIIVCMLVAAVVAYGSTYRSVVKENQSIQNAQPVAEEVKESDNIETDATATGPSGSYEKEIAKVERDIEMQRDYLENSVIMKIDPYHISTGILSYYVDGNEHMDGIMASYGTFISSGRMAEELYVQDSDVPVEDLRYLISFSQTLNETSGRGAVFQIRIRMPGSDLTEVYLRRVEEIMREYTSQLQTEVAEHRVTLLSSVQSEMVDLDIRAYQTDMRTAHMNSVRNLAALQTELQTVQETQNAQNKSVFDVADTTVTLKNPAALAVDAAGRGLLAGAGISCIVLILLYLFGGRLQDTEGFKKEFGMQILGVVRASEKRKRWFGFIDSWVFKLRGGLYGRIGYEEQIKIAAANIQTAIPESFREGKSAKIMLAGTMAEKDVELLCTKLASEMQAASVSQYTQLVFHSLALRQLENYDGVVFLEKRGVSHCKFIEQERKVVSDRGVEVLGTIVVC